MARALSNLEYATFMTEIEPDNLMLPAWGGVVQWGDQYILAFHMPSGEWALSDVTDGIPYGANIIPIQNYIQATIKEISPSGVSWYDVGSDIMNFALQAAAKVGALAGQTTQFAVQQVADALQKILEASSKGLGSSLIPLALIALAVLFLYVNPKRA